MACVGYSQFSINPRPSYWIRQRPTTQLGLHGGMGIVAEPAVTSASAAATSNKTFFNMLKSPRVFELNSRNSRIHGKIKSW